MKEIFHIILSEDKLFWYCESCWSSVITTGASEGATVGIEDETAKGRADGEIVGVSGGEQLVNSNRRERHLE
jgi:hypothetical protein